MWRIAVLRRIAALCFFFAGKITSPIHYNLRPYNSHCGRRAVQVILSAAQLVATGESLVTFFWKLHVWYGLLTHRMSRSKYGTSDYL